MDPQACDRVLLDTVARRGGAVTHDHLRLAGLSRQQIERRVGRLLTPIGRGVYVVGPPTPTSLRAAALLMVAGGVLSHRTAAELHRLPIGPAGSLIEVSSLHRTRAVVDGVRFRSTAWLPDVDVCEVDGVGPTTTVPRTLCDLAWEVAGRSGRRLRHVVEAAVTSRKCTVVELQACILSYRRRGRSGSRALGVFALPLLEAGAMPASELERIAVRFLDEHGIHGWQAQFRPPWFDGITGVVDFAWPHHRVVFEVDGRRWHTMTQAFDDDRRRDQLAAAAGWRTIRASWQQLRTRPTEVAEAIRRCLEP